MNSNVQQYSLLRISSSWLCSSTYTNTGPLTFLTARPEYICRKPIRRGGVQQPITDNVASHMDIIALNTVLQQTDPGPTNVPLHGSRIWRRATVGLMCTCIRRRHRNALLIGKHALDLSLFVHPWLFDM